jgi:hypothetical protein
MPGRADSLDEVPSTISSSSRMKRRNLKIEKPWTRATAPSTTTMNSTQVP